VLDKALIQRKLNGVDRIEIPVKFRRIANIDYTPKGVFFKT
jgi:hypothetical protein